MQEHSIDIVHQDNSYSHLVRYNKFHFTIINRVVWLISVFAPNFKVRLSLQIKTRNKPILFLFLVPTPPPVIIVLGLPVPLRLLLFSIHSCLNKLTKQAKKKERTNQTNKLSTKKKEKNKIRVPSYWMFLRNTNKYRI